MAAADLAEATACCSAARGFWRPGSTKVIAQTAPYDHCNMTVVTSPDDDDTEQAALLARFTELLLAMD